MLWSPRYLSIPFNEHYLPTIIPSTMNLKQLFTFSALFAHCYASGLHDNKLVRAAELAHEEELRVASSHTGKDLLAAEVSGASTKRKSKKVKDQFDSQILVQMTGAFRDPFDMSTDVVKNVFGVEDRFGHIFRFYPEAEKNKIQDLGSAGKYFSSIKNMETIFHAELTKHTIGISKYFKSQDPIDQKYDVYFTGLRVLRKPKIRNDFIRKLKELVEIYGGYEQVLAAKKFDARIELKALRSNASTVIDMKPSALEAAFTADLKPVSEDANDATDLNLAANDELKSKGSEESAENEGSNIVKGEAEKDEEDTPEKSLIALEYLNGDISAEIFKYLLETSLVGVPKYKTLFREDQIAVVLVVPRIWKTFEHWEKTEIKEEFEFNNRTITKNWNCLSDSSS